MEKELVTHVLYTEEQVKEMKRLIGTMWGALSELALKDKSMCTLYQDAFKLAYYLEKNYGNVSC